MNFNFFKVGTHGGRGYPQTLECLLYYLYKKQFKSPSQFKNLPCMLIVFKQILKFQKETLLRSILTQEDHVYIIFSAT